MYRILYVVSTLKRSGPTNQLFNLIFNIDRQKYEPHLISLSPEPPSGSAWLDYEKIGVRLYALKLSRLKGLFYAKKYLGSLVHRIEPAIIHTQGIRADLLNAFALDGYPSLCTSHNYPLMDYPSKFGLVRGHLMARQHLAAFRKLNVIACSHAISEHLGLHGVRCTVVQNGVDGRQYVPVSAVEKYELRRKLALPQHSTVVLSVGSLIRRKDMQSLIAAFETAKLNNARLVILGNGPQFDILRQQASSTVVMPGHVTNVAEYLGAADLFVSSSLAEGLPYTVLEAMACGLPCLLSDIPSHRELLNGGDIFFGCGDSAALANLFKNIKTDQLAEQGRRSRQIVEDRFSAPRMSQGYQDIYLELIGGLNG